MNCNMGLHYIMGWESVCLQICLGTTIPKNPAKHGESEEKLGTIVQQLLEIHSFFTVAESVCLLCMHYNISFDGPEFTSLVASLTQLKISAPSKLQTNWIICFLTPIRSVQFSSGHLFFLSVCKKKKVSLHWEFINLYIQVYFQWYLQLKFCFFEDSV